MRGDIQLQKNREPTKIERIFGYILFYGSVILAIVAVRFVYISRNDLANLSFWLAVTGIGISLMALALSRKSTYQMHALTALNFDEKMAMMTDYKKRIAGIETEKPSESLDDLGYVLDKCNYDLRAISHLRWWANSNDRKKLIEEYVIPIINDAQRNDTCKNNRKIICGIIENALKVDPKNGKFKKLKKDVCS